MTDIAAWMRDNDAHLRSAIAVFTGGWSGSPRCRSRRPRPIARGRPRRRRSGRGGPLVRARPPRRRRRRLVAARAGRGHRGRDSRRCRAAAPALAAADVLPEADAHPAAALELQRLLGLSAFERDVLLLCAAMELDTAHRRPVRARAGRRQRAVSDLRARAGAVRRPGLGRALARAAAALLAADRDHPAGRAAADHAARCAPTSASSTTSRGSTTSTTGWRRCCRRVAIAGAPRSTLLAVAAAASRRSSRAGSRRRSARRALPVVQLLGADAPSKRSSRADAARQLGLALYRPAGHGAAGAARSELETLARLWQRESLLLPVGALPRRARGRATRGRARAQPLAALPRAGRRRSIFLDVARAVAAGSAGTLIGRRRQARRRASSRPPGRQALERPTRAANQRRRGSPASSTSSLRRSAQIAGEPAARSARAGRSHDRLWARLPARTPARGWTRWPSASSQRATWDDLVLPEPTTRAAARRSPTRCAQRGRGLRRLGLRARG